jgi:hypothetical protein
MIRKIIIVLGVIGALFTLQVIVREQGLPWRVWLLVSLGPYLLAGSLAAFLKSGLFQTALVPFFLYYGIGTFVKIPVSGEYAFAHLAAFLMVGMAAYFTIRHLIKLKLVKITTGIFLGIILFLVVKYCQKQYIASEDLEKVEHLENRLLY